MIINVNGTPKIVDSTQSYAEIVVLAGFFPYQILDVTYQTNRPGDEQRQGTLRPGELVSVEDGMFFDVSSTTQS